jgi:hypothetical protein
VAGRRIRSASKLDSILEGAVRERSPRTIEDGVEIVALRVRSLGDFFHPLDPSPMAKRDLSQLAVGYLMGELRDVRGDRRVRLVLELPPADMEHADAAVAALRRHFAWSAVATRHEMRERLRIGLASLGIGLVAVAILIAIARVIADLSNGGLVTTIAESIIIIAWVILWRPVEILLFDWWPLREDIALFERLAAIDIECRELVVTG